MLKKRVLQGIAGNVYLQAVSTLMQLFGVPLCLAYWGEEYYGEWLLLFTIPGYLSISDFGLGASSTTEMAMMAEDNRHHEIQPLLKSVFWFIVLWGLIPFGLLASSNLVFPWYDWLKMHLIQKHEFQATFPVLVLYIYLSLFLTIPLNFYRVIKQYNVERYISTVYKALEFGVLLALVLSGYGIFPVALGYFLLRVCFLVYILVDLHRRSNEFRLWPIHVRFKEVRKVIKPGISGLFFYLGTNLLMQGTSTIVGLNLGSRQLVIFNTVRTLVNMAKQVINIINLSIFSEFSYAYGAKNLVLFRRLVRSGMLLNAVLAFSGCLFLFFAGEYILKWWTNGVVVADHTFLNLFLVYTFLGSISSVALTVILSVNIPKHSGVLYLLFIVLLLTVNSLMIKSMGLTFLAISLIVFEVIFMMVCFQVLLAIMESHWKTEWKELTYRDLIPDLMVQKLKRGKSEDHSKTEIADQQNL